MLTQVCRLRELRHSVCGDSAARKWQVALDQFVHHPFVLFPCFYAVKESIEMRGGSKAGGGLADVLRTALGKYRTNMVEDCLVCWKVHAPGGAASIHALGCGSKVPEAASMEGATGVTPDLPTYSDSFLTHLPNLASGLDPDFYRQLLLLSAVGEGTLRCR
jgi:hypothetical protein